MFYDMKTPGGGAITLTFSDESTAKRFEQEFKTDEDFMKALPDEVKESDARILALVVIKEEKFNYTTDFIVMNNSKDILTTKPFPEIIYRPKG